MKMNGKLPDCSLCTISGISHIAQELTRLNKIAFLQVGGIGIQVGIIIIDSAGGRDSDLSLIHI